MSKSPPVSPKRVMHKRSRQVAEGEIQTLSSVLLLDIFAHVRSVKGLATCSLVCRKWHALTWTYALEMDLSSFQNGTNQVLPVNDTKLVYLSALSPSVRHLNLRHCLSITDIGIAALTKLGNLRTLLLRGCRSLTDKALTEIAKMSQLQRLDITGLNGFSTAGLRQLGSLSMLECVVLHGIDTVDDRVLESLAKLKRIRKLDISACVSVSSDGIESVGRMLSLTALNLSSNSRLGQQRAWKHLSQLTSLESFKVKSTIFSEDQMDDFCEMLPIWSRLTELRLGFCQIRDKHCPSFEKLPMLHTLSIHNASSLKAESYCYFSKVVELDLSRSTIPVHAIEHLSRLERLELKNAKLSSLIEARPLGSPKRRSHRPHPDIPQDSSPLPSSSPSSIPTSLEALESDTQSISPRSFLLNPSNDRPGEGFYPSSPNFLSSAPVAPSAQDSDPNDDLNDLSISPPSPASSQHIFRRKKLGSSFSSSSASSSASILPFLSSSSPTLSSNTEMAPNDSQTSMSPPTSEKTRKSGRRSSSSSSSNPSLDLATKPREQKISPRSPTSPRTSNAGSYSSSFEASSSAPMAPSPSKSASKPIPVASSSNQGVGSSSRPGKAQGNQLGISSLESNSPPSPSWGERKGNGRVRLGRSPGRSETVEVRPLSFLHLLPNLRQLSLRVENVTDKDLSHISKCHKLRELDLLWLNNVTARGLQKLSRLHLIQQLNLTNCKSLTNELLQVILPNMRFLKAMSLAFCQLIGDQGLLAIASNSFQLRYLVLFQLPLVTNEGITSLVTLNDLEVLEISGCHRTDAPYCEHLLKEFLPRLHLNHNSHARESNALSTHCTIS